MSPLLNLPFNLQNPRTCLVAIALAIAGVLGLGFVLEYGFGVRPCPMCWWQRYAHVAVILFAVVGAARWPLVGAGGVTLAALGGASIAAWQVAAQQGWLPYPPSCTGGTELNVLGADLMAAMANTHVIPCNLEGFKLLGLSLAAWNLPLMLLTAGVGIKVLLGCKCK